MSRGLRLEVPCHYSQQGPGTLRHTVPGGSERQSCRPPLKIRRGPPPEPEATLRSSPRLGGPPRVGGPPGGRVSASSQAAVVRSPDSSPPPAIDVQDLTLSLERPEGRLQVLNGCSLRVPEGQLWMLVGPNGCGKSTLLKVLANLLRPDGGRMHVVGPRSFVFQNPDHQVVMPTVAADVAFGLGALSLPPAEVARRVDAALAAVGMADYAQRPIQTLSGGQKQRVAIAGALAEQSRLLLLDELTTFLDRSDQVGVLEAVRTATGGPDRVAALWVTHRLEELEAADGVALMEGGRIVLSGEPAVIRRRLRQEQRRRER